MDRVHGTFYIFVVTDFLQVARFTIRKGVKMTESEWVRDGFCGKRLVFWVFLTVNSY